MSSARTIVLKSYSDIRNEYKAAGTITPGHVCKLNGDGDVVVNDAAGGPAAVLIAIEDELQGKNARQDYSSGDRVQTWYVQSGEEFLAIVAADTDPAVGALLEVDSDGTLQAASAGHAQFQVLASRFQDDDSNYRVHVRRI